MTSLLLSLKYCHSNYYEDLYINQVWVAIYLPFIESKMKG